MQGTSTNPLEIEGLAAVCTGDASASTAASPWSMRGTDGDPRQRRVRGRLAANASPVTSTCKECCTKPLTPLDPDDADSVAMEAGYDSWFWLTRCTTEIQDGTACFRNKVEEAGHRFVLTSSLRTAWYQKHFSEIWDKYEALKNDKTPACSAIRTRVIYEKDSKHRIGYDPARGIDPRHVDGRAIDISYRRIGLSVPTLDGLADTCGLCRRVATDKYHYEVKP